VTRSGFFYWRGVSAPRRDASSHTVWPQVGQYLPGQEVAGFTRGRLLRLRLPGARMVLEVFGRA